MLIVVGGDAADTWWVWNIEASHNTEGLTWTLESSSDAKTHARSGSGHRHQVARKPNALFFFPICWLASVEKDIII